MAITDIQKMAGHEVEDKAFLAFERSSNTAGVSGIYFQEFLKNGSAAQNPQTIIANAQKVIDKAVYAPADIDKIFIYSNKAGTDVTITLVTLPRNGISDVHTGRIVNGVYVPCSTPAHVRGTFRSFFGFYYDDNTKNKFLLFDSGEILPEAH
jgi:hypothetical protein